ncbi:MAG: hypothetical protein ABSD52_07945 [Candidatus Cybelea sp.]
MAVGVERQADARVEAKAYVGRRSQDEGQALTEFPGEYLAPVETIYDVDWSSLMIDLRFGRNALGVCVASAMLAGCGGQAANRVLPANGAPDHLPGQKTFYYTGGAQNFTVPKGVRYLKVIARSASGASGNSGSQGGRGGRVYAMIGVTRGEKLLIFVGGAGVRDKGGFNGGADGGSVKGCGGGGGGGASDVRRGGPELANRILVAGGGAGAGAFNSSDYEPNGSGGRGGGSTGGSGGEGGGYNGGLPGTGGTQDQGGSGGGGTGTAGSGGSGGNGSLGRGGAGGAGCTSTEFSSVGGSGGGGGGGFYGGGGGGVGGASYSYGGDGGGGGGGSSYAEPSASDVHFWQGWKNAIGNGLVVFSW